MIDLIYLIIVLLMGSRLAKLSISGTAYALLLSSAVIFVLVSSLLVLNNPEVSAVTSGMARSIEQLGIGYPDAWRNKSKAFSDVIDGCYYLLFVGFTICLFISVNYEHKGNRMIAIRQNKRNEGLLLLYLFSIAIIFYLDSSGSSGFVTKRVRSFYNSEFLILCWEAVILYMAVDSGKVLRAIFNKNR